MIQPTANNYLSSNLQFFCQKIPFFSYLRPSISDARPGFIKVTVQPSNTLFNHLGTFQAGVIFTLLEVSGGLAVATILNLLENLIITKKVDIEFSNTTNNKLIAEVQLSSDALDAIGRIGSKTKKENIVVEVCLIDEFEMKIAKAKCYYYLRSGLPKFLNKEK